MSDAREILILTRLMAAITLAEFVLIHPVPGITGFVLVALVLLRVRVKARKESHDTRRFCRTISNQTGPRTGP